MRLLKNLTLVYFGLLIFGTACRSDLPKPQPNQVYVPTASKNNVYIVNEGMFNNGNGAISHYNALTGQVIEDVYEKVNGKPIGNICQSMCVVDSIGYIVVNNSQKIVIVSLPSFKKLGEINNLYSPRYFLPISKDKAYVTDLYSNSIAVIDLKTNTKISQISCNGSTEELILFNNKVYVTNTRTDKLYIIDVNSDVLEDSIAIGFCSSSLRLDKENKIWVFCTGDYDKKINASIYQVDPANKKVLQKFPLATPLNTWDRLDINGSRDTLYYLNNGVFQLPMTETRLPKIPIIASAGRSFYGLGINPVNSEVYLTDAMDYAQRGMIYRYKVDGPRAELLSSFKASVIPSDFIFY